MIFLCLDFALSARETQLDCSRMDEMHRPTKDEVQKPKKDEDKQAWADMKEIAVVGFGAFGRFFAKHLASQAKVWAWDVRDVAAEAREAGAESVALADALAKPVVVLALPMPVLGPFLEQHASLLRCQLLLDVCSLKMFAAEAMQQWAPDDVALVGTHPLFGPRSGANGIQGLNLALCNVRCPEEAFARVTAFFVRLGLTTYVTSPELHDRQMALSQALTHFVGRTIDTMQLPPVDLETKTYHDLVDIVRIIEADSVVLYENIQTLNPFAGEVRKKFLECALQLDRQLEKKDNQ